MHIYTIALNIQRIISAIINANAKVPGLFKDESQGRPITEVVALASKMYSITRGLLADDVKGVPKTEVKPLKE